VTDTSDALASFNRGVARLRLLEERRICENSLLEFVRAAWPNIDPSAFEDGWVIEALCEHLQALTEGKMRRLLINLPPRCGKSTIASVCWPLWTWIRTKDVSYTSGPQVRFLCSSYSYDLSLTLSTSTRRLLNSDWYRERWPHVTIVPDQNTKTRFDNANGGSRIATSVGGTLLGIGGDVLLVDDPHNVEDVLSANERATTQSWWKEFSTTRMNDPQKSAIVAVMQRLDRGDVSGLILDSDDKQDWTHLMVPMRHDPYRHCITYGKGKKLWEDPRTDDQQLMWPERFDDTAVEHLKKHLGPYLFSGRCQQDPRPEGGGIILDEWWQDWPAEKYPQCEFLLAALDPAYTDKELNDPSALTIWGLFRDPAGNPKIILMFAWQGHLQLNDLVTVIATMCSTHKLPKHTLDEALRLADNSLQEMSVMPRFPVDRLLIENKASGLSVVQEIKRLYSHLGAFAVEPVDPSRWGDKTTRLYSVQHMFADGMIYAPDRTFAQMVIDQVGVFPKAPHDDLVDTVSLALRWFRLTGMAQLKEEHGAAVAERLAFKSQASQQPLY